MEYLIYRNNPLNQFVQFQLTLHCDSHEECSLQLPAWRPGRYEITNYAQKIRSFSVTCDGQPIPWRKSTKDLWSFKANSEGVYTVLYEFHASQMDAGGSWSDDEQLYLNFINCCFEIKGRENEEITVGVDLPKNFEVATALPQSGQNHYQAAGFQHLVDSPMIASPTLKHYSYQIFGTNFHLWFQGDIHFDVPELLEKFGAFTKQQIEAFGEFPATDYHFLFQLLPYKHYHGVEHQFSTVITFGPAASLREKVNMDEFFGVSCHELYHFWNVCRIRPKELLPYDFSKEVYFDTGIVAEGVTTYMGDIFLLKSGYFSLEDFLSNMEKQLEREFESHGWQNQSICASSLDLWLDGYKTGIPEKKVSIYNRGALISSILDLMLLDQDSSLHEVMKTMWLEFGKPSLGYSLQDYARIIVDHYGNKKTIHDFFENYVTGTQDISPLLSAQLESINISLTAMPHSQLLSANWGIKTLPDGTIRKIHPNCPAYHILMQGDQIKSVNEQPFDQKCSPENTALSLVINRFGRKLSCELPPSKSNYYLEYRLIWREENDKRNRWMR